MHERELDKLETVLYAHGVGYLQTGVREPMRQPGRFPNNWLHIGVNARIEKGGPLPSDRQPWFYLRQNKHHRWSLDESQVGQYHLDGVLHPHIRWWEATDAPRKAIEFVECADLMLVALVCEDLAQNDDVAQLIRTSRHTAIRRTDDSGRRGARRKERSIDWSDARCSRCSKGDWPGTQTKPGIPSDARAPGGPADGQTGIQDQ